MTINTGKSIVSVEDIMPVFIVIGSEKIKPVTKLDASAEGLIISYIGDVFSCVSEILTSLHARKILRYGYSIDSGMKTFWDLVDNVVHAHGVGHYSAYEYEIDC